MDEQRGRNMQVSTTMLESLLHPPRDLDALLDSTLASLAGATVDVDSELEALEASAPLGRGSLRHILESGLLQRILEGETATASEAGHETPIAPMMPPEVEPAENWATGNVPLVQAVPMAEVLVEPYELEPAATEAASRGYLPEPDVEALPPEESGERAPWEEAIDTGAVPPDDQWSSATPGEEPQADWEPISASIEIEGEPDPPYDASEETVVAAQDAIAGLGPDELETPPAPGLEDEMDTGLRPAATFEKERAEGPVIDPDELTGMLDDLFESERMITVRSATLADDMVPHGIVDMPEEHSVVVWSFSVERPLVVTLDLEPDAIVSENGYHEVSPADIAEVEPFPDEGIDLPEASSADDRMFLGLEGAPEEVEREPLAEVVSAEDIAEEIALEGDERAQLAGDVVGAPDWTDHDEAEQVNYPVRPSEADQALSALLRGEMPLDDEISYMSIDVLQHRSDGSSEEPQTAGGPAGSASFLANLEQEMRELENGQMSQAAGRDGSFDDWLGDGPASEEERTPVWARSGTSSGNAAALPPFGTTEEQTAVSAPVPAQEAPHDGEGAPAQEDSLALVQPPLPRPETRKRTSFFRKIFGGGD
jgi:hypothetical protein